MARALVACAEEIELAADMGAGAMPGPRIGSTSASHRSARAQPVARRGRPLVPHTPGLRESWCGHGPDPSAIPGLAPRPGAGIGPARSRSRQASHVPPVAKSVQSVSIDPQSPENGSAWQPVGRAADGAKWITRMAFSLAQVLTPETVASCRLFSRGSGGTLGSFGPHRPLHRHAREHAARRSPVGRARALARSP